MKNLALSSLLLLTACASASGPSYQPTKLDANRAEVTIYRDNGGDAAFMGVPILVNNQHKCRIGAGGSFTVNVPANAPFVAELNTINPAHSFARLTPQAGEHIYLTLNFNNEFLLGTVIGAGVGGVVGGHVGDNPVIGSAIGAGIGGAIGGAALSRNGQYYFDYGSQDGAKLTREACGKVVE